MGWMIMGCHLTKIGEKKMKTVAIYSHKGGVGKTMTAVNLSYNLTVYNKRVLLVDMDQQGNASSLYRCYDLSKKSVYDILTGKCIPSAAKRRTRYKNLDIIGYHREKATERRKDILKRVTWAKNLDQLWREKNL